MRTRWISLSLMGFMTLTLTADFAFGQSQGLFGTSASGSQRSNRSRTFTGGGTTGGATTTVGTETGQLTGSERFVRENRQANQFVGSDTNEMRTFVGGVQAGNQDNNRNQALEGLRALTANINQPGNQEPTRARMYRTRVSAGFQYPQRTIDQVGDDVSRSVNRLPAATVRSAVKVEVVGRTAILTGTVSTDHGRALAEQLARLEPGVSQVQNRLVVVAPETSSPPQ